MTKTRDAKIIALVLLLLIVSMFFSCPNPAESVATIYVAVYYNNDSNKIACYWKDGNKTDLPCNNNGKANSIFVSGSIAYIAGCYNDG